MKPSQINIPELNSGLATFLYNQFYNPKHYKYIKLNISISEEGLDWNFAGVNYKTKFKINGDGNLRFFADFLLPK